MSTEVNKIPDMDNEDPETLRTRAAELRREAERLERKADSLSEGEGGDVLDGVQDVVRRTGELKNSGTQEWELTGDLENLLNLGVSRGINLTPYADVNELLAVVGDREKRDEVYQRLRKLTSPTLLGVVKGKLVFSELNRTNMGESYNDSVPSDPDLDRISEEESECRFEKYGLAWIEKDPSLGDGMARYKSSNSNGNIVHSNRGLGGVGSLYVIRIDLNDEPNSST